MKPSSKVLIIGGGPAGLTAAYQCGKKHLPACCFEADPVVGGLSRTVEYKGFRFDVGGHRFFTKIERVNDLWQEVLGDEFLTRKRLSRIYYNGRYFDHPLRPVRALAGLGPWKSFLIAASYIKARLRPLQPEDNFQKWITNRFGAYLYAIFFKTYTEKVWGIPCDRILTEWAAQRIRGLSLWSSIRNSFGRPRNVVKSLISEFHYPRFGPGQMYETMARQAEEMGSTIRLNSPVAAIHHQDGKITGITVLNRNEGTTCFIKGTELVSTMPLPDLIQRLDPPPPEHVLQAARALRFRSLVTVNLLVDRPQQLPDNWLYIHDPAVQVGRIQFFANWSPAMVPGPDKSSVGMEYFCWEHDRLWTMSDDDTINLAKEEISRLGIVNSRDIIDAFVIRMPKSYPLYDRDYRNHLDILKGHLSGFSNLHPCGRYGLFKYNNMDHSILTALCAVENILGARHDIWALNSEEDYFEEQARIG